MMPGMPWLRFLPLLLCCAAAQAPAQSLGTTPPVAPPQAERRGGAAAAPAGQRHDEYQWLRDDDARAKRPDVLRHLEAENRYTEAVLAPLRPLREKLQQEMLARIVPEQASVPVYDNGWWIWRQYAAGVDHPRVMRRRGTPAGPDAAARAEVLLDLPQHAIAQRSYSLGQVQASPDGRWLAWTEDVRGRGSFDLYIQDLQTRRLLPERIRGVQEGFAWAADNRTLFYVRQHALTLHRGAVWRHQRGSDAAADVLVHDEDDAAMFVGVRASASRRQVLIDIFGADSTELRAVPADAPAEPARVLLPRRAGVRIQAEHVGARWLLRSNAAAPDFELLAADDLGRPERWRTLLPARPGVVLEGLQAFEAAIVVEERVQARRRVRVLDLEGQERRVIDAAAGGTVALGESRDARATRVQVVQQSLVQAPVTLELGLSQGRELSRRQEPVPGHDLSPYRSELLWATARDGARVPVTVAWREGRVRRDGSAPLLLEGYGAYGESLEPLFGVQRLSLLERGFVIALAHVRGGGELGRAWYEAARGAAKPRSFDDFVDVTDYLVAERWAAPGKVFAQGASAGGLLVAAVANRAGARYRGMVLEMPFVDVLGAMLDPTLALTAPEWSQWGDPRERAGHEALAAWSPYDNIAARDYPAMLVTTALWDTRVPFDGPARYVARLRARKTGRNPVLLHVEMNAGHDGEAGLHERPRQWARQYALFLDLAGLGAAAGAPASTPSAGSAEAAAVLPEGEKMRGGIKLTR
jgi:oligopeptidase B